MPAKPRPSRDVAAEITNLIIKKLEEGVPPWSRPWRVQGSGGRPLRHCGTPYTGINTFYLWAIGDAQGYRSRYWMTFRQAEALGGNVRRGETGSLSVYYSSFKKTEANPVTGAEKERSIRFLRHYIVFNADQIDGLPAHYYPTAEEPAPIDPSAHQAEIDGFFGRIPADVRARGEAVEGIQMWVALPQAHEDAEQKVLIGKVERGGRLVEHQHFRFRRQRPGKQHDLPLAAGKLAEGPFGEALGAHGRERGERDRQVET